VPPNIVYDLIVCRRGRWNLEHPPELPELPEIGYVFKLRDGSLARVRHVISEPAQRPLVAAVVETELPAS
jgi:hypothetical protein